MKILLKMEVVSTYNISVKTDSNNYIRSRTVDLSKTHRVPTTVLLWESI